MYLPKFSRAKDQGETKDGPRMKKCLGWHFFIYACADSSKWGLSKHCARSAFYRTPTDPEICGELVGLSLKS